MKITKKALTIITIILINFIINTNFVSGQLFPGLGPNAGGTPGPLLGPGPGGMSLGNDTSIYNKELGNVINTQYNGEDINDPIRIGAGGLLSGGIEGIVSSDEEIDSYETALQKILKTIQNIVNYALGILGLVALIYLIIQGFIILTAAGDDSKVKKGLKGIKNAFIAIAGIGLSRIIISFIIRLINTLAT